VSAGFLKNDAVAARRRCNMEIYQADGVTPANRGDASTGQFTGFLWVQKSAPDAVAATGTLTNVRRPLVVADFTITATDTANDRLTKVAHGLETGDGPFRSTSTAGGVTAATDYWVIKFDADKISLATTLALAYAGTKLDITGSVGAMVFQDTAATQRGVDGKFLYEAPQAEINFDGSEFFLFLSGNASYAPAQTSVAMAGASGFDAISEGSNTYGDTIRLIVAMVFGKSGDYTAPPYTFKGMDGVKTRATITANATGRTVCTVGDLTP
jgi:hypothetical protein